MTKREILSGMKTMEQKKATEFKSFILSEGFTEGISKSGTFGHGESVFYKQLTSNRFLAFNIPYYGKTKNASFCSDFWSIKANSEKDFLINKVEETYLVDIRLGFTMQNIDIYRLQLAAQ